ncbi:MAG: DUF4411 family protein, partial [bacterium]
MTAVPMLSLLDADVFIQAHRQYYPFDVCPGFWDSLIRHHKAGRLASIDRVRSELGDDKDELAHWAKRVMPASAWLPTDAPPVTAQYGTVMAWV